MRVLAAVALLAACSGGSHGPVDLVTVYAFAGDIDPEPNATVLAHDASGKPFAGDFADAVGHSEIQIAPGGTITVVFPGSPDATTPAISLVTVPAPAAGSELDIHGPPHPRSATAAGALLVDPPPFTADSFSLQLGCTTSNITSFPASIDVSSLCLGSDANLDVLLLATTGGQISGYTAGRVELVDGFAMFQPAAWQTTSPAIPITVAGVSPQLTWNLRADGQAFGGQTVMTSAPIYTGLVADGATLVAAIGQQQVTTHEFAGVPAALSVAASDFLPAVAPTLAFDGVSTFTWTPADISADASNLHLEYDAPTAHIVWDFVLPADSAGTIVPTLAGDLAALVPAPGDTANTTLQYVQAPTPFDGTVYVEAPTGLSTVAPLPTDGELRTSRMP
jgi:hypothetical protein